MKKYFNVCVDKYSSDYSFDLWCVSTLENPKDNAVTFITKSHMEKWTVFQNCKNCLIFWPIDCELPDVLRKHGHVIIKCSNPHLRYCQFFEENNIDNLPVNSSMKCIEGSWISVDAKIGVKTNVFPGAYIGSEVEIGDNCYIGSGVRIIGEVKIGNNVVIRENTVIGADGLTTDKDERGNPVRMPQFGGVQIGDHVRIGANTVIARGAIDNTVIDDWVSIDNSSFISHNVHIGKRSFIVGETIMFGSSVLGQDAFVSGNSTIRNGIVVDDGAMIGMGSVVTKSVGKGQTVKGNPAK